MSLTTPRPGAGSWRRRASLLVLPALAVPMLVTAATPGLAQVAEPDPRAWSEVGGGCSYAPDVDDVREHPGPATAGNDMMSGTANAITHTASAVAAVTLDGPRESSPYGEDCGFDSDFSDVLTIGAGSTDLPDGTPVTVEVTVALAGTQTNGILLDRTFQSRSEMSAGLSVNGPRLTPCTGETCSTTQVLFAFDAWSERYVDTHVPWGTDEDGYIGQDFDYGWEVKADRRTVESVSPETPWELCSAFPCPDLELDPFVFPFGTRTVEFTTRVGDELLIEGGLGLFVQAYDDAVTGAADFGDGLSATFAPGADNPGIELDFLSAPDAPADTTAPVLALPQDITVPATSSDGAVVTWTATAVDAVSGARDVTCTPASGSTFAVGTTPVTCTAEDAADNEASGTFDVVVTPLPAVTVAQLLTELKQEAATMPAAVRDQFTAKLAQVERDVAKGATGHACKKLADVVKSVSQRTGKGLSTQQAAAVNADLATLGTLLGC